MQIAFNMKNIKIKGNLRTPLVILIINPERTLEKILRKVEFIATKCHSTHSGNDSGSYEINVSYYGERLPEYKLLNA